LTSWLRARRHAHEFAALDEEWAVRVPDHLSWEEAATLPCAGVTAWNSIVGRSR